MTAKTPSPKIKPFSHNPRTISRKEAKLLRQDLEDLGDLGGVVHDLNSDQIVGGHQRLHVMFGYSKKEKEEDEDVFNIHDADITIVNRYDPPTRTGTVADGYVTWKGERYSYRQVRFDEVKFRRANIVANLRKGNWNWDELANSFDNQDLATWGFDDALLLSMRTDMGALRSMLDSQRPPEGDAEPKMDRAQELLEKWQVRTGDLFGIGKFTRCPKCGKIHDLDAK